jgi:hypothetical protein
MLFMMPVWSPIPRRQNAILRAQNDVIPPLTCYFPPLGLGYPTAWGAIILFSSGPKMLFLILPCAKKLLDFWMIFLMQFVSHFPCFHFLTMQQSWA